MGGLRESNSVKSMFLGINGNGNLYEKSKEPREGFVEHINPMTGQSVGYWKEYYNGLVGYLNYIGINTRPNAQGLNVQYFTLGFIDYESNDGFSVVFPLLTAKGGLHRYVKSFVKYFKNIDYSKELVFNSFKKKPDDQYAPSNLVFAYPGEGPDGKDGMIPVFYKTGQNGWPDAEKFMAMGVEKVSYQKQDEFCYAQLVNYINEFNANIGNVRQIIKQRLGISDGQVNSSNGQSVAPQQYSQQPTGNVNAHSSTPAPQATPQFAPQPTALQFGGQQPMYNQPQPPVQSQGPSFAQQSPQQIPEVPQFGQQYANTTMNSGFSTPPPPASDYPLPDSIDDLPF